MLRVIRVRAIAALVLAVAALSAPSSVNRLAAQADLSTEGKQLYTQIKTFTLTGGSAEVTDLTLKRDRVEMSFKGTFYFGGPAGGKVTGAVFIGQGALRAEAPPSDFERANVMRLLGAELVESDFKTAVLRFSDDTFSVISAGRKDGGTVPAQAQKLADEFDARTLQELGLNVPARLAASVLNHDAPGVFYAQYDGGRRGRFSYVLDHQCRVPVADFGLTAGEKGVIFQYLPGPLFFAEVWMAFASLDDVAKNTISYSDTHDVVDATNYQLGVDVRDRRLTLAARIDMKVRKPEVRAVSFSIGESLSQSQKSRLDRQLRLKRVRLGDKELAWVQEDWEGGFTVFLPQPVSQDQTLQLSIDLSGDYLRLVPSPDFLYPINNVEWLPRHGYLDRATFDLTFRHRKSDHIASIGTRLSEEPDPEDRAASVTHYKMTHPVALAVFALGPFERKAKSVTFEEGGRTIPVEFNSVPGQSINKDFFLGELDNAVRFFAAMFGPYPYDSVSAAIHPFGFGQGFPTLLMIPPAQRTGVTVRDSDVYSFIAHEASHQWWGNIVAWRSYRDQWLSEGFANYSGVLYAAKRGTDPSKTTLELVRDMRESLRNVPGTATGAGKGRLNDIGPIIQGLRLNTSKTLGAYQALTYDKGALVLRMLHFLLSNPTNGNDTEFIATMKEFVEKYRNGAARTEDFWAVASQHFARTPIASKFGLRDLDWFFKEWVYETGLPTYQMEYETVTQPDGSLMVKGTVKQTNVDPDFQMVLPLVMTFEGNQQARTAVRAMGPSSTFELKVPQKPIKVELDPFSWVLSEKTTSRAK